MRKLVILALLIGGALLALPTDDKLAEEYLRYRSRVACLWKSNCVLLQDVIAIELPDDWEFKDGIIREKQRDPRDRRFRLQ